MITILLPVVIMVFTMTAPVDAKEDCYSCHGQKGKPAHVDRISFEQSVHGSLRCAACHAGLSDYPHRKVAKVNCGNCHFTGVESASRRKAREYKLSAHGQAVAQGNAAAPDCQTCHGSHAVYPSSDERSRTNRRKIPALCSPCHPGPFEEYAKSIHGNQFLTGKNEGAPTCFDCHAEHRIPRVAEEQWKLALIRECGGCHAGELDTYHKTYHGKVTRLGYTTVAKCADCHGAHLILPPSDPDSKLSEQNIVSTCASCHPGANVRFAQFYAHAEETNRKKYPVLYYTYSFMTALLVGVFAFFLTHTALWSYRALKERMNKKGGA